MKFGSFCSAICIGVSALAHAQDTKMPPLPDGPLLKRTPDFAAWNVTDQGNPVAGTGSSSGNGAAGKQIVAQAKFVKTGSTIFEQSSDATGKLQEIWHINGIRLAKIAGAPTPTICPDFGGGDIFSINFSTSDFAGLDWISKDSYAGIVKYQGKDCILFKGEVSPISLGEQNAQIARIAADKAQGITPEEMVKVPAVAYIDLETRLPVVAVFGSQKRTYQYNSPPTEKLAPPVELTGPLKAYLVRLRRVSAPPSKAF
jgi:hypothetical protein